MLNCYITETHALTSVVSNGWGQTHTYTHNRQDSQGLAGLRLSGTEPRTIELGRISQLFQWDNCVIQKLMLLLFSFFAKGRYQAGKEFSLIK